MQPTPVAQKQSLTAPVNLVDHLMAEFRKTTESVDLQEFLTFARDRLLKDQPTTFQYLGRGIAVLLQSGIWVSFGEPEAQALAGSTVPVRAIPVTRNLASAQPPMPTPTTVGITGRKKGP